MKRSKIYSLILFITLSSLFIVDTYSVEYVPLFHVSLLTPNTSSFRIQWSQMIESALPEIGIEVDFNEMTGWGNIGTRLNSREPTYADGGFDLTFLPSSQKIDWDNTRTYKTSGGDNYQSYSNSQLDTFFSQYLNELNLTLRAGIFQQIQEIMYDDLPSIGLISARTVYGMKKNLTGIDTDLIYPLNFRPEFWNDPDDNKIVYAIPADLRDQSTFVQESYYDGLWMSSVYSGLFERKQFEHTWEPVIASNFTFSPDYLSITVDINPNATFSSGEKITAEDIEYSYSLYQIPVPISNIVIDDSDTLTFSTDSIDINLFEYLHLGIVDKSVVEPLISTHGDSIFDDDPGTGNAGWSLVTSCGPFMVESFSENNVHLVPNPYWNELSISSPTLNELNFTFIPGIDNAFSNLSMGLVDMMDSQYYPSLDYFQPVYDNIHAVIAKDYAEQHMAVNMLHPILGTGELTPVGTAEAARNVRKAISHLIDRQYIVNTIMQGVGVPSVIPISDGCYGFDNSLQIYSKDVELAKSYMELAGYTYEIFTEPEPTTPPPDGTTSIDFTYISVITALLGIASLLTFLKSKKKVK